MADTISPPTTPLRSQPTTPSSPLTTTVIKTTMVKRSPANELTMSTATTPIITSTTPTTPSATTAITSAASLPLTLAERTALLVNQGNVQDVAKENNKPTNKCDVDTRLSVKERIAAFVAGNVLKLDLSSSFSKSEHIYLSLALPPQRRRVCETKTRDGFGSSQVLLD
uniref:Uncharacterized protein n=1 Tax=Glossina morsitans morsitans TaxID=37546 RepID=A0A1B0FP97_GLOMM